MLVVCRYQPLPERAHSISDPNHFPPALNTCKHFSGGISSATPVRPMVDVSCDSEFNRYRWSIHRAVPTRGNSLCPYGIIIKR